MFTQELVILYRLIKEMWLSKSIFLLVLIKKKEYRKKAFSTELRPCQLINPAQGQVEMLCLG